MNININDYLHAIRRRLWLPIALPLVAALVAAGFIYIQPEKYQGTATVVVPALSARGYSTSATIQYFSSFKDVLISAPVVDKVASETGEKKSDLAAGLTATTASASSNIITVTYVGPNKATVANVAGKAAVAALDALMGPQVAAAQNQVTLAQASLTKANDAISKYAVTPAPADAPTANQVLPGLEPDANYKALASEIAQLNVNLQLQIIGGTAAKQAALERSIANLNKQAAYLEEVVAGWRGLQQNLTASQASLDKAEGDLNAAMGEQQADSDPKAVTTQFTGHISRIPEIARTAGVAAGVALLLALLYIVLMEFLRPASTVKPGQLLPAMQQVRPSQPAAPVTSVPAGAATTSTAVRTRGLGVPMARQQPPTEPAAPPVPPPGRSNGEA